MQDEAELVGERALAGGPVGGELALVQLDEVLGLSAGAVDIFIEMAGVRALEREVRELRQANEILRKASAWFAQAELDRPLKR